MGEMMRWSVTYTKHLKQKRKVYQDGFLELHTSSNKVVLYDDCEKLLECRILKEDEVLSSGETVALSAYLVDVGDPQGDHKATSQSNFQGSDAKLPVQSGLHGHKIRKQSVSLGTKNNAEKDRPRPTLSPSQRIIREFKKSRLQNYSPPQSSPDASKSAVREWQVLYTTDVTQKAKKYHDGLLRLAICGSFGRQVMLFDASRKLLDKRFIRKDELVNSGESLAFDAYLVEIGECRSADEDKPLMNSNSQGTGSNKAFKKGFIDELRTSGVQQDSPDTKETCTSEWQVLFTTQLTQKAKKYHDGFLRISFRGSQVRQAMLYDKSRELLDGRFLKKDEVIRSGESITFDAHLVDIGDPAEQRDLTDLNIQKSDLNPVQKTGIMHEYDFIKAKNTIDKEWHALYTNQITQKAKKFHNGTLRLSCSSSYNMQVTLLDEEKIILSTKHLNKYEKVKTGCTLELPKYLVEVGEPSGSSEGKFQNVVCSRIDDSHLVSSSGYEVKTSSKPLRDAREILSILKKPMAPVSVTSRQTDSIMENRDPSFNSPEAFSAAISNPCEHDRQEKTYFPDKRTVRSTNHGGQAADNADTFIPKKLYTDEIEADSKGCLGNSASTRQSSLDCASHAAVQDERKSSEEHTRAREADAFPSFDLGFGAMENGY